MGSGDRFRGLTSGRRLWLAALVGLTLVHGAYRVLDARPDASRAVRVSRIMPGDTVTELTLSLVGEGARSQTRMLASDCQVLVVFDPACPHCRKAAAREAERELDDAVRIVWVGEDEEGAQTFRPKVHHGSEVAWLEDIGDRLAVRGVPAAFLLTSKGVVRKVWPYHGTEEQAPLADACRPESDARDPAVSGE